MPKYLIADFVVRLEPKFNNLKALLKPFEYFGERSTDIELVISEQYFKNLISKMAAGTSLDKVEEFAYANAFNKAIIKHNAMLVHSSAVVCEGKAYLFSAQSGVGKSTHTRLWKQAFGNKIKIINDDKPVVKVVDGECIVYGTPFDGGSGIALNESAPLQAIIFIERGEDNSIRKATSQEIIKNLYLSTVKFVDGETAKSMLSNFDTLIANCNFYILTCNMDISAAYTAYNALIGNN